MGLKGDWVLKVGPAAGRMFLKGLKTTCRLRFHNWERAEETFDRTAPVILVFWHSRQLMIPYCYPRHRQVAVLVSRHRDGEIIGRLLAPFGYHFIRGSSTRGSHSALRSLGRAVGEGLDIAITPDGPVGPPRQAKMGAVYLARKTGAVILPLTYDASPRIRVNSWDRFVVPVPFSTVHFSAGNPFAVPPDAQDLEPYRQLLEEELNQITDEIDQSL